MVSLQMDGAGSHRVGVNRSSGGALYRLVINYRDSIENHRHMPVDQRQVIALPLPGCFPAFTEGAILPKMAPTP